MKIAILFIVAVVTFTFFYSYPAPPERILNIQNYFITVSGIISGIIIAYVATKLFNLKQEREQKQIIISKLSDKLTNYRRLLYYVMRSRDFWTEYSDLDRFKKEFDGLTFEDLHGQKEKSNELLKKYYDYEQRSYISDTTADLYLSMEAIYGKLEPNGTSSWIYDNNLQLNYSVEALNLMIWPSNQIWYYLEGRYGKHTEGLINDQGIWVLFKNNLPETIAAIDEKFRNSDFDRKLLAGIATEFYSNYLPRLIELTKQNQAPLPGSVRNLFGTLVIIFCIGVIFPLFIQCLNINDDLNTFLTLSAVGIIVVAFVNLLFDFYKIMKEEIKFT